jgi:hypothetical protein
MKFFTNLIKENALIVLVLPLIVPGFIFVRNSYDTPLGVFFRSAFFSIAIFIILLALTCIVFHDSRKIILFASITYLFLYLYGGVYDKLAAADSVFGHHKELVLIYLVLVTLLAFLIYKIKISSNVVLAIKFISVIFIILQFVQFIPKAIKMNNENKLGSINPSEVDNQIEVGIEAVNITAEPGTPDVYYIILDLYARNDLIEKDFSFDNSDFTDSLTALGFYVADCSRSNYTLTRSSLASSLNMVYLQGIIDESASTDDNEDFLKGMIKNSTVFQLFELLEYQTLTFETGYEFTEITNVDRYLVPSKPVAFLGSIHPYEILLFKNSVLKILYDTDIPLVNVLFDRVTFPYTDHVNLQYFIFDELVNISTEPQPTFTFAHITVPHTPFVFRADGSFTTDRRYFSGIYDTPVSNDLFIEGYINQLEFINQKILDIVQEILLNSSTPPIIILQGDHGVILEDRLPILNAYYFPGMQDSELYAAVSPVNSFRLLFNEYFNSDYPLLEDLSYDASYDKPYQWSLEPEKMERCNPALIGRED